MKFKNQNSLILNYMNWTNLSQVTKLHYVYIFILLGTYLCLYPGCTVASVLQLNKCKNKINILRCINVYMICKYIIKYNDINICYINALAIF